MPVKLVSGWVRQALPVILALSACLTVVAALFLGYWASDNELPRDPSSATVSVIAQYAIPGDKLAMLWKVKVVRSCDGAATRWLTFGDKPGMRYRLQPDVAIHKEETENDELPAELSVLDDSVIVPPIPSEDAVLHTSAEFYCNPLQHWLPLKLVFPPAHFMIKAADG